MTRGRFGRWVNDEAVSGGPDLADEPALAWRDDLPVRAAGPRARWSATPRSNKVVASVAAGVVGIPFGVLAAFYENSVATAPGMVLLVVVVAPLIEESVKGAAAIYLAEVRPWLVPAGWVLVGVALAAGLGFAVLENLWYLEVLIDDPSERIVRWRWIAGPIVHGVGSTIVGVGAARMWRTAMREDRRPEFGHVRIWIVAAAIWHGAYNAAAVAAEVFGAVG